MPGFKYEGKDLEAMTFASRYHEWILSLFRPYLGKKVAEVGAGSGSFTDLLLKEPIEELVAIEPSKDMYSLLTAGTGIDARVKTHNDFFTSVSAPYANYFDSIVYVNVLEHVENEAKELSAVYASLAPGGYACIFVPALPWLYSPYDAEIGHYRRYTKTALATRVRDAGFEVIKVGFFDIFGILPWFLFLKVLRGKPSTKSVALYDRLVVPLARIVESLIPPPIGKNLLLVARKQISDR